MPIRPANSADLEQVRRLLNGGRRVYLNLGHEDLAALLQDQPVFAGEEAGQLWGFAGYRVEERPATLPDTAPTRVYLQALALAAGYQPAVAGVELLTIASQAIRAYDRQQQGAGYLLIVHGADHWLEAILPALGFTLTEQIRFYRLELRRGERPLITSVPAVAALRPMAMTDLTKVAELDAATFEPLWHYSAKELWPLLFNGRAVVALIGEQMVGYSALTPIGKEGHLTRLAVHPAAQGHGVGRQLMADTLAYAHSQHMRAVTLNTQVSNLRSQQLYQQFGFQNTHQLATVYTKLLVD